MKEYIYADHAATTALSKDAFEAMRPYLEMDYANPSTLYSLARSPRKAIANAREVIASMIGAKPGEIFFTSGGTESDNWALMGTALNYAGQKKRIITSCIEHHAILNTCAFLEQLGFDVVYLPVDRCGVVSPDDLRNAITPNTILVSVMYANNEIGTIQPIAQLASVAHEHGIPFHTDAVQAIGHVPVSTVKDGFDMLSASAHKFNGPKGTGFLYLRDGIPLIPFINGGGQEMGMRSGTENVAGIVGMATALAEHIKTLESDALSLEQLRTRLINQLHNTGIDFIVNGLEQHVPGSLSLSFKDASGEAILHRLDLMGISIATGSACNSKEDVLSHVINAIKVPTKYANGTIRITLGTDNTIDQVDKIAASLRRIINS